MASRCWRSGAWRCCAAGFPVLDGVALPVLRCVMTSRCCLLVWDRPLMPVYRCKSISSCRIAGQLVPERVALPAFRYVALPRPYETTPRCQSAHARSHCASFLPLRDRVQVADLLVRCCSSGTAALRFIATELVRGDIVLPACRSVEATGSGLPRAGT